jgi:hypothetical protein
MRRAKNVLRCFIIDWIKTDRTHLVHKIKTKTRPKMSMVEIVPDLIKNYVNTLIQLSELWLNISVYFIS